MKKIAILIILAFTFININAVNIDSLQTKTNNFKDTVEQTVKEFNTSTVSNKIYDDVKEVIEGIAKGLKTTSRYVFKVLIVKYVLTGTTKLILLILSIFGFKYTSKKLLQLKWGMETFKERKKESREEFDKRQISFKNLYWGIITLGLGYYIISTIIILPEVLMQTFNPGYYVLIDIIDIVKQIH